MKSRLLSASFCTLVLLSMSCTVIAENEPVELLWPNGAPNATGTNDIDKPTLTIFLPKNQKTPTAAIVICPGGGYGNLAIEHEGSAVGEWLNSIGVAGLMLKYRLPRNGYRHPIPLQDAQRAIRMVRNKAKDWNIDPAKVGIMGFSAGGHLASTAGTHYDRGNEVSSDLVEKISCRPDFIVLMYPVVSFKQFTHIGSMKNLLGPNPDPALIDNLSNELQVTSDTPPTFLVHANDDKGVMPENSINFYLALRKANVPAEMHIYEKGGHGFGIGRSKTVAGTSWQQRLGDWLVARGMAPQP